MALVVPVLLSYFRLATGCKSFYWQTAKVGWDQLVYHAECQTRSFIPTLIGREKPSKVFERTDLITLMVHHVLSTLYARHT